ncbi:M-phase phosphoprotein 8 isoform X1 [Anolis sagrei]|uniref:M-phase phosphoprotein 8 isoform X1 n=1 Tax=Anolis sagrei TaxID=38937 RepID=UPI003523093F
MAAARSDSEEEEVAARDKEKPEGGQARPSAAGDGEGEGGGESDDEEDVYEVEKILDVKTEGSKILYKVRWKGYPPDDDTWEPEEHLEDCREVLLEFQKKIVETKPKLVKKETQKPPLNDDLFEADSEADSDCRSDAKGDMSPKKKKKKRKEKEDKSQDEMQKKKSKPAKGKERPGLERENSSDSFASDSKPKKRTSELKEDTKEFKKQRREDTKEATKKKGEVKDGKKKSKESKSLQKGKHGSHLDLDSSTWDDSFSQAADSEDWDSDSSEDKQNTCSGKDRLKEELMSWVSVQQPDSSSSTDDSFELKVKRKKKKHKKAEELEDGKKVDKHLEKKSTHKKQKAPEKTKAVTEMDTRKLTTSSPVPKGMKLSVDERGRKSTDSAGEVSSNAKLKNKEAKLAQSHAKDVLQKSTITEGKEKNTNWRVDEEKMKERPSLHPVGESLFEKFTLDPECSKGGAIGSKKSLSKSGLNAGDTPRERSTLSKEKEIKKSEAKEKLQKRLDSEKEDKGKKEHRGLKSLKEIKSAFDVFSISPEEKNEYSDNQKREDLGHDYRSIDEFKSKDRQSYSRSTRDETDTWAYIAAEGDREVTEESSDTKQQTVSLGMDMQLEWLSLEDFQKHLDGEDENHVAVEAVSPTQLRDAVKNGQYATVKMALNSNEEYNLEQEDSSGMTLVMLAAAGGHDDILRLLIRKGAKVNCRQKNGTTALIHAAEKNNLTTVAILLEAGACMNLQQNSGETALMKACKRGNYDIVRLMIESGADCNILSKHQSSALHFAKQCNNSLVYELLNSHLATLSRVAEDTIREYFEARLNLMEPVFDIACHRLCEGPDYSSEFTYKPPQAVSEGSGVLLFIFHANFFGKEVVARLCGPCSVQAVVLNDNFQLPVFLPRRANHPGRTEQLPQRIHQDSHFIYSFSPIPGLNKLFIRLVEAPTAKVKLLIGAYRVQLAS